MQAFEGVFIDPYLYTFDLFGLFLINSNSFFKFHLCIEILFNTHTHPQKLAPAVTSLFIDHTGEAIRSEFKKAFCIF